MTVARAAQTALMALIALIVGLAAITTSCTDEHPDDHHAMAGAAGAGQTQLDGLSVGGAYHVKVTPIPNPPGVAKLFACDVVISAADLSAPVTVASVALDAWMPTHKHGMEGYKPTTKAVAGQTGRFHTTGMFFNMPGQWEFKVAIKGGPSGADDAVLPILVAAQ